MSVLRSDKGLTGMSVLPANQNARLSILIYHDRSAYCHDGHETFPSSKEFFELMRKQYRFSHPGTHRAGNRADSRAGPGRRRQSIERAHRRRVNDLSQARESTGPRPPAVQAQSAAAPRPVEHAHEHGRAAEASRSRPSPKPTQHAALPSRGTLKPN